MTCRGAENGAPVVLTSWQPGPAGLREVLVVVIANSSMMIRGFASCSSGCQGSASDRLLERVALTATGPQLITIEGHYGAASEVCHLDVPLKANTDKPLEPREVRQAFSLSQHRQLGSRADADENEPVIRRQRPQATTRHDTSSIGA
jgi:hypothetical protein